MKLLRRISRSFRRRSESTTKAEQSGSFSMNTTDAQEIEPGLADTSLSYKDEIEAIHCCHHTRDDQMKVLFTEHDRPMTGGRVRIHIASSPTSRHKMPQQSPSTDGFKSSQAPMFPTLMGMGEFDAKGHSRLSAETESTEPAEDSSAEDGGGDSILDSIHNQRKEDSQDWISFDDNLSNIDHEASEEVHLGEPSSLSYSRSDELLNGGLPAVIQTRDFGLEKSSSLISSLSFDHGRRKTVARVKTPLELQDCTELRLYVDDYSMVRFRDIVSQLEGNVALKKLQLVRLRETDSARTRSSEDMEWLFNTLRNIFSLQVLVLTNFSCEDSSLLIKTLSNQSSLRTLKLHYCYGTLDEEMCEMLSSLRNLRGLEVEVSRSFPLGLILECPTLEVFKILSNDFRMEDSHFAMAFLPLKNHTRLSYLDVEAKLSPVSARVLFYALADNISLEAVDFSLLASMDEADDLMVDLAQSLENNTTLKSLRNHCHSYLKVSRESKALILTALQSNSCIEKLRVFREDRSFSAKKSQYLDLNRIFSEGVNPTSCASFLCLA